MYLFAPPGLAAPLQQLFKFSSRRALIKAQGRERSPDVAVEAARRLASPSPMDFNNDFGGGDETFGADAGMQVDDAFGEDLGGHDDFQFDIPDADPAAEERAKGSKANAERLREEHDRRVGRGAVDDNGLENTQNATSEGPLAVFDQASVTATQQSQSQAHTQADEDEDAERAKGNWSKNTMKAVTVLRDAVKDEGESVTFDNVAKGVRLAPLSPCFQTLTWLLPRRLPAAPPRRSSSSSSCSARATASPSSRLWSTGTSTSRPRRSSSPPSSPTPSPLNAVAHLSPRLLYHLSHPSRRAIGTRLNSWLYEIAALDRILQSAGADSSNSGKFHDHALGHSFAPASPRLLERHAVIFGMLNRTGRGVKPELGSSNQWRCCVATG